MASDNAMTTTVVNIQAAAATTTPTITSTAVADDGHNSGEFAATHSKPTHDETETETAEIATTTSPAKSSDKEPRKRKDSVQLGKWVDTNVTSDDEIAKDKEAVNERDAPKPSLLRRSETFFSEHLWNYDMFIMAVCAFFLLLLGAFVIKELEGWSFLNSMYFSAVTISYTGFGDLAPATDEGKIFLSVFSFISIGFMFGINFRVSHYYRYVYDEPWKLVLLSVSIIVVMNMLLAVFMHLVEDDLSFGNALYFCSSLLSAVGFGDIVTHSDAGKIVSALSSVLLMPLYAAACYTLIDLFRVHVVQELALYLFRKAGAVSEEQHAVLNAKTNATTIKIQRLEVAGSVLSGQMYGSAFGSRYGTKIGSRFGSPLGSRLGSKISILSGSHNMNRRWVSGLSQNRAHRVHSTQQKGLASLHPKSSEKDTSNPVRRNSLQVVDTSNTAGSHPRTNRMSLKPHQHLAMDGPRRSVPAKKPTGLGRPKSPPNNKSLPGQPVLDRPDIPVARNSTASAASGKYLVAKNPSKSTTTDPNLSLARKKVHKLLPNVHSSESDYSFDGEDSLSQMPRSSNTSNEEKRGDQLRRVSVTSIDGRNMTKRVFVTTKAVKDEVVKTLPIQKSISTMYGLPDVSQGSFELSTKQEAMLIIAFLMTILGMMYLVTVFFWQAADGQWDFHESFYFTTVFMSVVGFGESVTDATTGAVTHFFPTNNATKILFTLMSPFSLGFQVMCISVFITYIEYKAMSVRKFIGMLVGLFVFAFLYSLFVLGEIEDWSYIDRVYFVPNALATLGLGDVTPVTVGGRYAFIVFIFLEFSWLLTMLTIVTAWVNWLKLVVIPRYLAKREDQLYSDAVRMYEGVVEESVLQRIEDESMSQVHAASRGGRIRSMKGSHSANDAELPVVYHKQPMQSHITT